MISDFAKQLFKEYIELDTSSLGGEAYEQAVNILEKPLKELGYTTEKIEIPESVCKLKNRVHLLARKTVNPKLPTLLIYNHMDVVPASYPDAFTFRQTDGKLYGRGACDHKGSTVVVIDALRQIPDDHLRFNILFWATCDEETDQAAQLDYMTEYLKLPSETIVYDPDTFAGGISVAHLSLAQITITIHGTSAHSGMSHLGKNAIEDAAKVITFLQTIRTEYEQISSKISTFENLGGKVVNRCNVNVIAGGGATNVIPDRCTITVDCRYIPDVNLYESHKKFMERLKNFCTEHHISYTIAHEHTNEGNMCDHHVAVEINEVYQKISGEGGLYAIMGSTPLAEWTNKMKLPHFGLGVARADTKMHGVDEFCYEKDMTDVIETLKVFLTRR